MTELTHDKTYRFLVLFFMAVIALSSVLIVIELNQLVNELQSAKVIEVRCTQTNNETYGDFYQVISYYSDGSFTTTAQDGACYTDIIKSEGFNYSGLTKSTTTVPQP